MIMDSTRVRNYQMISYNSQKPSSLKSYNISSLYYLSLSVFSRRYSQQSSLILLGSIPSSWKSLKIGIDLDPMDINDEKEHLQSRLIRFIGTSLQNISLITCGHILHQDFSLNSPDLFHSGTRKFHIIYSDCSSLRTQ